MHRRVSSRDDLEAALRARPDDATLAVYADLLQAQGEPRGELIALDVRGVRDYKRRGQLLTAWLGDEVALAWDSERDLWYAGDLDGTHATFECGFLELRVVEADYPPLFVARLIDSAAGRYLRRLHLTGSLALLAHVALVERPWLQHLAIERPSHLCDRIPTDVATQLVTATPNLEVLDLAGRDLLGDFVHPSVRELGLVGADALGLVDGPPWSAVHAIDFAFAGERRVPRGLFSPSRFPALRRVSFERAEPGGVRLFEELGSLAVRAQLTHLVLPSVRTREDAALVQAAIDQMPQLRELVIARDYAQFSTVYRELRHPRAHVQWPPAAPWPPRERFVGRMLLIDGTPIDPVELVDVLETARVDDPFWHRFWGAAHAVVYGGEHTLVAADLVAALDALELADDLRDLREQLRSSRGMVALAWINPSR